MITEINKTKSNVSITGYYILKYLAIITMFIDHLNRVVMFPESSRNILYMIGRIAFPIFAYEIVECFHYTKNKKKHFLRMFILAIISEPFFDLMLFSEKTGLKFDVCMFQYQNVIFTFLIGFIVLIGLNKDWKKIIGTISKTLNIKLLNNKKITKILAFSIKCIIVVWCAFLSTVINTDYSYIGILFIAFLEVTRTKKHKKIWSLFAFIIFEGTFGSKLFDYVLIYISYIAIIIAESLKSKNIKCIKINKIVTSKPSKIICRFFYPVHLALLILLKICINY